LLEFVDKQFGSDYVELRKKLPIKRIYPFSSANKTMTTIMHQDTKTGKYRMWTKGASEMVLAESTSIVSATGDVVPLTEELKKQAMTEIQGMAQSGLRTIGLAYADLDAPSAANGGVSAWNEAPPVRNVHHQGLTLIGVCGIKDPVRAAVPGAVRDCQLAGIKVRMLTGDNIHTAKHIARECGILTDDGVAIEGPAFRALSDEEVDAILPKLQVMARSSPQDKYKLVSRLRYHGEVVAVTGDGTNDAPQLKEADVGFSMGIAGTEVAKEASDIILLDDNFSSIVKAVQWGRNVYDSIRKFVQFQLTVNIVAVIVAFVGAVSHGESPLKPVQMLWVNLIMDTMAALALATEAPTADLLKRKPYGRFEGIITPAMWRNIIGQALYQIIVLFVLMYVAHWIPALELPGVLSAWTTTHHIIHTTIIFNSFVFCQLFNEINSRKLGNELNVFSGLFSNQIFWIVMVFTVTVQVLIVQYGGEFAGTHPLTTTQWGVCIAIGALCIPYGFILRLIPLSTAGTSDIEEAAGEIQLSDATKVPVSAVALTTPSGDVPETTPSGAELTPRKKLLASATGSMVEVRPVKRTNLNLSFKEVAAKVVQQEREIQQLRSNSLRDMSSLRKRIAPGDATQKATSALQWASAYGHLEIVKELMFDTTINPAADENLALRWACANGHVEIVKQLLTDSRVDPLCCGNRPMKLASKYGHGEIVRVLLASNTSNNDSNKQAKN
jgi:Ca2+-transporting ATPase